MQPANDIQAIHSTRRGFLGRLHSFAVRDSKRPQNPGAAFVYLQKNLPKSGSAGTGSDLVALNSNHMEAGA